MRANNGDDLTTTVLWPAVDVGGTSVRLFLVASSDHEQPSPPIRVETSTPSGLAALAEAIGTCIRKAAEIAAGRGYRVADALAIGTPGRIEIDDNGRRVIAARTAINLESFPGEMDGVDLASELAEILGIHPSRVFWENDAVVQGLHLIDDLVGDPETRERVVGHIVVCINPGTGLGGCVAAVRDGSIEVFTDGHISELLIHPVELSADLGPAEIRASSSADGTSIDFELRGGGSTLSERLVSPDTKQPENLLAGSGMERTANAIESMCAQCSPSIRCFERTVDGKTLSDLIAGGSGSTPARTAGFVADLGGRALARLMTVLHEGAAVKSAPYPDWSPHDVERIRGVTRFVLGGGISRTPLGRRMIEFARHSLRHWPELEIFERDQVADAGALGAFSLIPPEVIRAEAAADPE